VGSTSGDRMRRIGVALALGMAVIAMTVVAATQAPAQKPAFEVASVKPNVRGAKGVVSGGLPGGGYSLTNGTLEILISIAYKVRGYQISGGPTWIATDRWDIEARAPEGGVSPQAGPPDSTVELMLQSLLEDRFQLKIHREVKEAPVYELTVAKNGPKMKLSLDQDPVAFPAMPQPGGSIPRGRIRFRPSGQLDGNAVPVEDLVIVLSDLSGRPVINRTELKDLYDFTLEWSPELMPGLTSPGENGQPAASPNTTGPSLFTALQEQLGLKLESSKGPVEVLVIDSVQKPSEN
jgi:bla regulator protein blaR1